MPRPRKLRVDSARMTEGIVNVNITINGANIFGRISLNMILKSLKPITFALKINGLFFSSNTVALEIRATRIQLNNDKATVMQIIPIPKISINIEIKRRSGIE